MLIVVFYHIMLSIPNTNNITNMCIFDF